MHSHLTLRPAPHWRTSLVALACSLMLAGCGGGASANGPAPGEPPPPVTPPTLPSVEVSAVAAADPGSALTAGWQHGGIMQIFVRSYRDSNGDGHGDLPGLISQLDYLQDLGVKGLWLMPITASEDRDHGYAVKDYRAVESTYGSLADMDELLRQAHARGIGVIIDHVINHSSTAHPLFVNASSAGSNAWRDWYLWSVSAPTGWNIYGNNPWYTLSSGSYFAAFWQGMPDFNLRKPEVVAFHHDALRFWLNRGVDGMRFDAVGHLVENGSNAWDNQPENYPLMRGIQDVLAGYQNRYMVCEAPGDPVGFAASTACGSAFAFNLSGSIISAARGNADAVADLASKMSSAPAGMAPMLANHDGFAGGRVWNQLNGNLAQYKLAAATPLLLPGHPFIYYGEEIGMSEGIGLSGDAALRSPMSWSATAGGGFTTGTPYRAFAANLNQQNVASQLNDPESLHAHYKGLLTLRNSLPSLARGSYAAAARSGAMWAFQRRLGGETSLVVFNYGSSAASLDATDLPAGATLQAAWPAGAAALSADVSGNVRLSLPAQSLRVYRVNP